MYFGGRLNGKVGVNFFIENASFYMLRSELLTDFAVFVKGRGGVIWERMIYRANGENQVVKLRV